MFPEKFGGNHSTAEPKKIALGLKNWQNVLWKMFVATFVEASKFPIFTPFEGWQFTNKIWILLPQVCDGKSLRMNKQYQCSYSKLHKKPQL